ncbi:MAG: glycosyltransferase family 2 protein [Phycisphaerales bacterium]|nr:glycosyltransferase family 2 protein [Phycisphaerales bacterium]
MNPNAIGNPRVSVVIPTFGRPAMLARAIESVLAQTITDWELIISDDEREAGEGWAVACAYADRDARITACRNLGVAGQASNLNHAMAQARGEWIKPLYDDDELEPSCLETMLDGLRRAPGAVMACALAIDVTPRGTERAEKIGERLPLEVIAQRDAHFALYTQDVDIGIPSQVMVRRDVIESGAAMTNASGMPTVVDLLWYANVLRHGDLLMVNAPLVKRYQTGHDSITNNLSRESLFEEFRSLRRAQLDLIPAGQSAPSLEEADQQLRLIHAALELRSGHIGSALRLFGSTPVAGGHRLFAFWLLRRLFPGRFGIVARHSVSEQLMDRTQPRRRAA